MSKFGDSLRLIRTSRGYSQEQFSQILDSNQATISSWERGDRTPTLDNIKRIAEALHVPLSMLVDVGGTGNTDDFIQEISDAFRNEPKLRVLFDKARYMNSDDLRILIRIAQAFANERIEFGEKR